MKSVRWLSGFALAMVVGSALAADPQIKTITQPKVEVRSGPSAQYYPTAVLNKGDVVTVLDLKNGFLAIKPPDGSFDWVNVADLEVRDTTANVVRTSELRVGSAIDPTRYVDTALRNVVPGTQLSVMPGASMVVGKETLIKVRPPIDDVRYIPADAIVEWTGAQPQPTAANVPTVPPSFGLGNTQSTATPAFGPSNNQPSVVPTLGQQPAPAGWDPSLGQQNTQTGSTSGEGRKHSRPGAAQGSNQQVAQTGLPPAYGQQGGQSGAAGSYGLQNSSQGMAANNGQQYVPPSPVPVDGQQYAPPATNPGFGQQGPIVQAAFDQPATQTQNSDSVAGSNAKYSLSRQQDNRQSDLIAPNPNPSYDLRSARGSGTPVVPAHPNNSSTISRSNQLSTTMAEDPRWHDAESLEKLGDIDLAIRLYDEVGRLNGTTDPNLAIRAMNRAQYLRNAISAGVLQPSALSRSAKTNYTGTGYTDTATTDVHPNFTGQPNMETQQRPIRNAQTEVYPETPKYLPEGTSANYAPPALPTVPTPEAARPAANLTKPLMAAETPNSTGQKTWSSRGRLVRSAVVVDGKQFYKLLPDDPKADWMYCTNQPGVNLNDYVERHVQIYGNFYYHKQVKQYYMEVLTVAPVQ